jgi:hypothetical protein
MLPEPPRPVDAKALALAALPPSEAAVDDASDADDEAEALEVLLDRTAARGERGKAVAGSRAGSTCVRFPAPPRPVKRLRVE